MAIGVAASVLLLPLNAKAQKTPSGLKDSNPPTELRVSKKMTPAERQAKMNEHIAKHPLLHKRLVPQMAKRDSLVRLNRNIEAGIKTKQTPQVPILRAKDAKPMTFWGNVLYDATWGAESMVYTPSAPKLPSPSRSSSRMNSSVPRVRAHGLRTTSTSSCTKTSGAPI